MKGWEDEEVIVRKKKNRTDTEMCADIRAEYRADAYAEFRADFCADVRAELYAENQIARGKIICAISFVTKCYNSRTIQPIG